MLTLRALAHLMAYPNASMQEALPEMAEVIGNEERLAEGPKQGF